MSVTASLQQNSGNICDAEDRVKLLKAMLPPKGTSSLIANDISRIPDSHLLLMFRTVASFGLHRWAPELHGANSESMYNLLHEHIALSTFEQVASGFGYSFKRCQVAMLHWGI